MPGRALCVLNVAEKPSVAREITRNLSRGHATSRRVAQASALETDGMMKLYVLSFAGFGHFRLASSQKILKFFAQGVMDRLALVTSTSSPSRSRGSP